MESHDPVNRADGFGFIFASCTIDYRSPAHFDGVLVGYDYESGETVPLPDALKERLR